MYLIKTTKTFERDVERCRKRGYDMSLLGRVMTILEREGKLPAKYKSHKLTGDYLGCWECHIKPDWLLVWKQNDRELLLLFTNTGTHADLF